MPSARRFKVRFRRPMPGTRAAWVGAVGRGRRQELPSAPASCSCRLLLPIGAQGRTQTFNLWFVGPALRQLSYSGQVRTACGSGRLKDPLLRLSTFWEQALGEVQPPATAGGSDFLAVGVGIEPTSRVFQTHANPSQLSDRRGFQVPGFKFQVATKPET